MSISNEPVVLDSRPVSYRGPRSTSISSISKAALSADDRQVRRYWLIRSVFGLIWAVDATLKWLPGFRANYLAAIEGPAKGQPAWLSGWFSLWIHVIAQSPTTFAILTAIAETAICLSLLLGLAQRVGFAFGALFALFVWGVGEGFGGPYMSGSTDIGCAVMYTVVFVALWAAVPRSIRTAAPSLDRYLARRGRFRWMTFDC